MTRDLNPRFKATICSAFGASTMEVTEFIQELWSGSGQILRIRLDGVTPSCSPFTVIAKHVRMLTTGNHPRGWNSVLSHQRKLKSYQVAVVDFQYVGREVFAKL